MVKELPKNLSNCELDGDPVDQIETLHAQACRRGESFYLDPVLKLWVTTRQAHLERGYCCGNSCRHCPWDHEAVR